MLKKYCIKAVGVFCLPLSLYVLMLLLKPHEFASITTVGILLQQSFIPTIIGYGLSWGFIVGIWDFTVGARIILSALIGASFSVSFGFWGLTVGCIGSSLLLSLATGGLNWIAKIPSLVISFGLVMVYEILGQWYSGSLSLMSLAGKDTFLGIFPGNMFVFAGSFVLFYLIFNNSPFSYHTRAIGNNELLSKDMGMNVPLVKFLTYVVGGLFLGIASVLQISYAGSIGPQVNLTSIALVFRPMIGLIIGLALSRICNLAVGIYIGALSINIIFIGIIALGLPDTMQNIFLGVFLLAVMAVSNLRERAVVKESV
ncbi:MAG: hypothetical protein WCR31_04820 [Treponema sp.]